MRRKKKTYDSKEERTLKELAILNSTYGEISRHIIWGNKNPRDISDWIVPCNFTEILLNAIS